jgi:outer membrane lipoprotein-sorting protein
MTTLARSLLWTSLCICVSLSAPVAADPVATPKRPPLTESKKPAKEKTDPALAKFLAAWAKAANFEASFKQTMTYKQLDENESSTGHVWVKKPGRLRWDETNSTQKLSQILNGKKLTSISERLRKPGYRTIDVWEDGLSLIDKAAFSFLSQERALTETYFIKIQKENPKVIWLELRLKTRPKEPLVAEISKDSYVLRALSTETPESLVSIEFSDVNTEKSISSKVFEWTEDKEKDRVHQHAAVSAGKNVDKE